MAALEPVKSKPLRLIKGRQQPARRSARQPAPSAKRYALSCARLAAIAAAMADHARRAGAFLKSARAGLRRVGTVACSVCGDEHWIGVADDLGGRRLVCRTCVFTGVKYFSE